ncbi:ATP-binding cassette domain-containing protein [Austwickia sp. TVS 96-490-7B]|uniref:ATP-binding cassette domain-containing protein n=1 Tax=Austwickia sp. TVS 96-490-7B TaxID=2830843 RepID=UPI00351D7632
MTWRLAPGDRVGIVGVNGAGKSTLLRAFLGEVDLTAGRRKVGKTVVTAFLSQEVTELERLADTKVIDAISEVRSYIALGKGEISASQLAQRLGFTGLRQQSLVGELSGGERRRLQFLRLLMTEPNVLVLDEPTNDLDIETLTSMEDVLDGWAGTLLVVSHDRYLLERMCDRQVALLGDGKVRDLPGGVEQYLELRHQMAASSTGSGGASGGGSAGRAPAASGAAPSTQAQIREARRELNRVDRQLSKLSQAEEKLHTQMVAQAADHAAVLELNEKLRAIVEEREELELAWLEAAEIAEP